MKFQPTDRNWIITRRDFLKVSGMVAIGEYSLQSHSAYAGSKSPETAVRFGIVTDSHYADADPNGTRFYRESIPKMKECISLMNEQHVDFVVELGDFKDQGSPPDEAGTLRFLSDIEQAFAAFNGPRYHVLGNHDADSISKNQFSESVTNTGIPKDATYYSFDSGGVHFVVLDANFNPDGSAYDHGNFNWTKTVIPGDERDWLTRDLESTSLPVIVFVHQLLDGEGEHYINNAADVRNILQNHNSVLAVFQGHMHTGNYSLIENIHYYTLKAMVEGTGEKNSSYAIVEVGNNNDIHVTGYRNAESRKLL